MAPTCSQRRSRTSAGAKRAWWIAIGKHKQVKGAIGEVIKQYKQHGVEEETVRQAWHKYGAEAKAVLKGRVIKWDEYLESTTRDFDW